MQKAKLQRSPWEVLGGVRFALAMIVACAHLSSLCSVRPVFTQIAGLSALTAVICFLMVSGYSIAHSLERSTQGFYRRRLLRVYPLYILAVLYGIVPDMVSHTVRGTLHNTAANLAFLQTFTVGPKRHNEVVWSLAIEVACYLLAPLFYRMRTATLLGVATVSGIAFAIFPTLHNDVYYAFLPHGSALLLLGWAWVAGFVYHRHRTQLPAGLMLLAAMLGLCTLNRLYTTPLYYVPIFGSVLAIVFGARIWLPMIARRVLSFLGDLSYPFYLFHGPTFFLMANYAKLHGNWGVLAVALGLGCIGLIVDALLKRPTQRLADAATAQGKFLAAEAAQLASNGLLVVAARLNDLSRSINSPFRASQFSAQGNYLRGDVRQVVAAG